MKKLWALLAIVLTFTLTMEVAHAKRLGGGKSFGRTYQTTPSQPQRSDALAPSAAQQPAAARPASAAAPTAGKGLMGGLLGGLLAGGLIAALFAGGAFEGVQLMDIVLILAVLFLIMALLRRRAPAPQPAYAGAGAGAGGMARQPAPAPAPVAPTPVFGTRQAATAPVGAVPMSLPHGFDSPAFTQGALEHYRILQDAWNRNDLVKIREYCLPDLYDQLRIERASLPAEQHTELLSLHSELVRADQKFGMAEVSVRFSGRYRDAVEGVEDDFTDIWHLERDFSRDDAPWYLAGVETV